MARKNKKSIEALQKDMNIQFGNLLNKNLRLALLSAAVLFCSFASNAYAGTVSIQNNISVSASSGQNSYKSGNIHTGSSSVKIFSETVTDGEIIQYIRKEISGVDQTFELNETRENKAGTAAVSTNVYASTKPASAPASTTIFKQNLRSLPALGPVKVLAKTKKPEVVPETKLEVKTASEMKFEDRSAASGNIAAEMSKSFISIIYNYIKHALSIF